MPDLHAVDLSEPERNAEAGKARDQGQQIVFLTYTENALKELLAVENSDSVKEHDQAREADGTRNLGFRCEGADSEADKEHGADAKGEAENVDLADQVADADGEKRRQDRLAAEDIARKIQHCPLRIPNFLTGSTARIAKLPDNPVHQLTCGRRRIFMLVVEPHPLPLERAHLVERLHFDPFDIL